MVHYLLFDIDGTLIRTGGAGVKAFEQTFLSEFGIANAIQGINFSGRTDTSLVRQILELHRVDSSQENFSRFFAKYPEWLSHFLDRLDGGVCEGVLQFIEQAKKLPHGPVLGLLTGNVSIGAELKLRHFGLWDLFKIGSFADDHEERNQIAVHALRRGSSHFQRELHGSEVVVIGDTPLDIACGKAIEARTLAVATGQYSVTALRESAPNWAVENLGKLTASEVCA
jgi:phosphoglycolate phosphatase-like HAD superfamily hydrolase